MLEAVREKLLTFGHLGKKRDIIKEKKPSMNHRFQQENWMWSQCVDGWQEPRLAAQNAHHFPVAVCYVAKELKLGAVCIICLLYLYKHRIRLVEVVERHRGAVEFAKRASRLRE